MMVLVYILHTLLNAVLLFQFQDMEDQIEREKERLQKEVETASEKPS